MYGNVSINLCPGRYRWKKGQAVRNPEGLDNLNFESRNNTLFADYCSRTVRERLRNSAVSIYTNIICRKAHLLNNILWKTAQVASIKNKQMSETI